MKRDRIALFGGSFNPPHIGHLLVANAAARQFQLDEIRWIPNHVSPDKKFTPPVSATHRLEMTKLLVADHPSFSVWDIEIVRGGVSYTVDTLNTARAQDPDFDWYLLLGEDTYTSFDAWREPDTIRNLAQIIVYPRNQGSQEINSDALRLSGDFIDIASSQIRELISRGAPLTELLPKTIEEYIRSHQLYQND
ncbi:MAG: nicotinate (nicotinamide) nucleotide adenylyltransferase [Rhodothermia bacterium]|nr:MAG: nicotinate (nicotinamide) nucleotide adenylyltransferase [Rhodothermia bacterium]